MTRVKTSIKLLITLGLVLLAICVLSPKVNAAEVNLEEILNMIPATMELNIKEVEYEKATSIIEKNINQIFEDNNIDLEANNIKLDILASEFRTGFLHNARITLVDNSTKKSKIIDLSYNNTNSYNKDNESYVKKLKLTSPRYYEVELNFLPLSSTTSNEEWEQCHKKFFDMIGKYYTKQVNDNSIVIKAASGAGGTDGSLNLWTWESGTEIAIFKDGVLYDTRIMGDEFTIPVINVPSDVADDQITNYITTTIANYDSNFAKDITKITKGAFAKTNTYEINIPNGYTIEGANRDSSYIIVNKEVKNVITTDTTTNIKLDTTTEIVPEGTKLVAEKVTSGDNYNVVVKAVEKDVSKFVLYDINLINNNAKIQPNGKVTVSIPVPEGYDTSKIVVYRVAEDGTKTKYDTTIKDGYIIFETDHFSNYVVAEENKTTTEDTTKPVEDTKTEDTKKDHIKDETPKTGTNDIASIICSVLSLVSIAGIALVKKF